jgi:RecA-family ATPase
VNFTNEPLDDAVLAPVDVDSEHDDEIPDAFDYIRPAIAGYELGKWTPPKDVEVAPKFLFKGGITLLAGAAKAGKSTFSWHLCQAVAKGTQFLGNDTIKTRVLYVTEQSKYSLYTQLKRDAELVLKNAWFNFVLIENNNRTRVKTDPNGVPIRDENGIEETVSISLKGWDEQVEFWRELIRKTKSRVFIIDTAMTFMHLRSGEINDTGVIQDRLSSLRSLFQEFSDLSILVLTHVRKTGEGAMGTKRSDQDDSDVIGSQAFVAAVDQIITLTKATKEHSKNTRLLKIKGRYVEEEEILPVVFQDKRFCLVEDATGGSKVDLVKQALKNDASLKDLTQSEIAKRLNVDQSTVSRAMQS